VAGHRDDLAFAQVSTRDVRCPAKDIVAGLADGDRAADGAECLGSGAPDSHGPTGAVGYDGGGSSDLSFMPADLASAYAASASDRCTIDCDEKMVEATLGPTVDRWFYGVPNSVSAVPENEIDLAEHETLIAQIDDSQSTVECNLGHRRKIAEWQQSGRVD
jgi:hypothetical protein